MNSTTTTVPSPVVREERIMLGDRSSLIIRQAHKRDSFNLSTGEVSVARIIDGERIDTQHADLVIGNGEFAGGDCYTLTRIYRTPAAKFFVLNMQWTVELGFVICDLQPIRFNNRVLVMIRNLIARKDIMTLLNGWYCGGWLPQDDVFVRDWVATELSCDDYEAICKKIDAIGPVNA